MKYKLKPKVEGEHDIPEIGTTAWKIYYPDEANKTAEASDTSKIHVWVWRCHSLFAIVRSSTFYAGSGLLWANLEQVGSGMGAGLEVQV